MRIPSVNESLIVVLCLLLAAAFPAAAQCPAFAPPVAYPVGSSDPRDVSPGDFNGDGLVDLAVGISGGVAVLFGNGDGTFDPAATFPVTGIVTSVAVGDFNADGDDDLAAGGSAGVSILISNGDGTFAPAVLHPAGGTINWIETGDVDGDGDLDLVGAKDFPSPAGVVTLLGTGTGTFAGPIFCCSTFTPRHVSTGDFNEDGDDDIILIAGIGGTVTYR